MSRPEINEVSAEEGDTRREWLEKIGGNKGEKRLVERGGSRCRKDGKFKNNSRL